MGETKVILWLPRATRSRPNPSGGCGQLSFLEAGSCFFFKNLSFLDFGIDQGKKIEAAWALEVRLKPAGTCRIATQYDLYKNLKISGEYPPTLVVTLWRVAPSCYPWKGPWPRTKGPSPPCTQHVKLILRRRPKLGVRMLALSRAHFCTDEETIGTLGSICIYLNT